MKINELYKYINIYVNFKYFKYKYIVLYIFKIDFFLSIYKFLKFKVR